MMKQGFGYMINLASKSGQNKTTPFHLHSAIQYGLASYSENLFYELIPYGIKVTAICPDHINSALHQDLRMDPQRQTEQMPPTHEIVRAVNYLLDCDPRTAIKKLNLLTT